MYIYIYICTHSLTQKKIYRERRLLAWRNMAEHGASDRAHTPSNTTAAAARLECLCATVSSCAQCAPASS